MKTFAYTVIGIVAAGALFHAGKRGYLGSAVGRVLTFSADGYDPAR